MTGDFLGESTEVCVPCIYAIASIALMPLGAAQFWNQNPQIERELDLVILAAKHSGTFHI